jgi:parallel beta-helix repeat protein
MINAAEPVRNWQKCAGPDDCAGNPNWNQIYYADVQSLVDFHPDSDFAIRQVFQNGRLLNRSRYPDTGWSYPTSIPDPRRIFSDSSISRPAGYFNGSVCHLKTQVWQINQIDIADYSGDTITLSESPWYDISTRFGYYITNVAGEINEEGEWAYDPASKRLFIWPEDEIIFIEITYRKFCLRTYGGVSWNEVRGLALHNAYAYGIWVCRASDVRIEDNTVEHSYEHGIYVEGWGGRCDNNQIINNTVRYACCYGIVVDGESYDSNVRGNYVYGIGAEDFDGDLMNGRGEGIFVGGPFTLVYNNRIDCTGHTGLYLSGGAWGREVSCNYITNSCLSLSDGGGIYAAGFADGPQEDWIHHNICEDIIGCLSMDRKHDVGSPPTMETHSGDAPGLYIDEEGNHRILEHNTVINSHMTGLHFHWAPGNVVRHNTFYANRDYQVYLSGTDAERKRLENDEFYDNVMFAGEAEQKTFFLAVDYDSVQFGQSDNNYFYHPYSEKHILVHRRSSQGTLIREELTLEGWSELSGYDGHSREFSYLGQFSDLAIDPQKRSRIIYNASLDVVSMDLGSEKFCDVDGNKIYGSVSLQPFESMILITSDFETP